MSRLTRKLATEKREAEAAAQALIADAVLARMASSEGMRTWLRATVAAMDADAQEVLRDGLADAHVEALFAPGEESGDG